MNAIRWWIFRRLMWICPDPSERAIELKQWADLQNDPDYRTLQQQMAGYGILLRSIIARLEAIQTTLGKGDTISRDEIKMWEKRKKENV